MTVEITFLGAAGTVTGSKYLVAYNDTKILVDVGMFQGPKEWRARNWDSPPLDLSSVSATLLTHAHIDHTGILPRYVSQGLRSRVYCTGATEKLTSLLLRDSARLQEEEAEFRRVATTSRHSPPLPLYTLREAEEALKLLHAVPFNTEVEVAPGVHATWSVAGHILGAAIITLKIGGKTITFSGDLGRYHDPITRPPQPVAFGDALLIESTYGDRLHSQEDPKSMLAEVTNRTIMRGGSVLIPSFAVGRTQAVLYYLRELQEEGILPSVPVILDSPMARDATSIYAAHPTSLGDGVNKALREGRKPFDLKGLRYVKDREESKRLNSSDEPSIIVSASGMLTGGRVLHHLRYKLGDPRNTILFVGFQPPGGRGAQLLAGQKRIRVFHEEVPVMAEVAEVSGLSAHGDRDELLRWCRECSGTPSRVFVVHGEPDSARNFGVTLERELEWRVQRAGYQEKVAL